ncbi:15511_t:CDS:2 [Rhizophagus irregularis]|nr:15511_t:CDS:2 [Rhizophagus irregularis]
MPLPSLPDECFNNVLSFLNRCTLHKCLLCLNEDEISSLIPYGINISHQPPLFEYEKFVKKFDHCNCVIGILEWLKFELIVLPTFQQDIIIQKLIDIIYHMFMRARSNLKEFVIFMDYGSYDLPNISTFTTYNPGITNLRSLKLEIISYSIKSQNIIEFLRTLSKVCNGIIRFKIWLLQIRNEILLPILDIIKSQPINNLSIYLSKREFHLKGLTWLHNTDNYDLLQVIVMINSLCGEALVELYSNVATIETVKIMRKSYILVEIEVDNQVLLKSLGDYLKSVENLSFNFDFYGINLLNYFEYFTNNCKANLKKLSINLHNNNLSRKDFLKCIDNYQRVHNSLKILEIKQHEFYWSKEEREIIRSLENQGVCLKKLGD